jgi:glutathione-regulated potassium-efflux system ancillary protein KefC
LNRSKEVKPRRLIGVIGLVLASLLLVISVVLPREFVSVHSEIYPVVAASGAILSSVLLAEALGVAPAVFEVLLGFAVGLVGIRASETLRALSLMGSASLMFFAGLEMDLDMLSKSFKRSFVIGLISFVIPLATTTLYFILMGSPLKISLMIATGVSTTSVAVVYSIFRKMGFLKSMTGQTLLAATMVADILSIVTFSALMMKASYSLIVYILSIVVVPPILGKALKAMPELAHEAEVKLIIAILLAAILFSEAVGIHAVLFSFVLGLAFSGAGFLREEALRKLEGVVFGFLAPMFFTSAGIEVARASPISYIYITAILLAISYPAKLLASYLGLRLFCKGLTQNLLRVSNVFSARLTMSTIIAYAGLTGGLLSSSVSGGIMLSAVIATLIAGLLVSKSVLLVEEL